MAARQPMQVWSLVGYCANRSGWQTNAPAHVSVQKQ